MTTKPASPKTERRVKLYPTTGRLIELRVGKEVSFYWVTSHGSGCYGQAAFRMTKLVGGGGNYDVLLDGPASSCECRGFVFWGMGKDGRGCRHIAALQALIEAGKL